MFRPRIRANKLQCPPPCKAAHQKFIPRSGSETNVNESPPAWEAELVIIFQNAPVRQAFCVLHTLYSSERDELDVYTASSPNDFLVPKESGKCSLSVAVVFTQISRSLQPEIMTKTKELRRPDNEAVKINVWRPHSATRHSLPHTDNKKKKPVGAKHSVNSPDYRSGNNWLFGGVMCTSDFLLWEKKERKKLLLNFKYILEQLLYPFWIQLVGYKLKRL